MFLLKIYHQFPIAFRKNAKILGVFHMALQDLVPIYSLASSVPLNSLCSGDIGHLSALQTGMLHLPQQLSGPGPSSWMLATPTTPHPQPFPYRGCSCFSSGLRYLFPTAACLEPPPTHPTAVHALMEPYACPSELVAQLVPVCSYRHYLSTAHLSYQSVSSVQSPLYPRTLVCLHSVDIERRVRTMTFSAPGQWLPRCWDWVT